MTKALACLLLPLWSVSVLAAVDPHHSIASKNRARQTPAWVPAAEAVNGSGVFAMSKIQEGPVPPFQHRRTVSSTGEKVANSEPCLEIVQLPNGGSQHAPASFATAARQSRMVITGTVADITAGFYDGLPSSLVHVSLDAASPETVRDVYFIHPVARFSIGADSFCRTSSQYANVETGDTVLLLANGTIDRADEVYLPAATELLVEHAGRLLVPLPLKGDGDLQNARFLREVAGKAFDIRRAVQ